MSAPTSLPIAHDSATHRSAFTAKPPRTGMQHPTSPIPVAVLGATAPSASASSPCSPPTHAVQDAVNWKQVTPIPPAVRDIVVRECTPQHFLECKIVFSGLDADVAGEIEEAFRAADLAVFSNAKNFRRDPHVPLIVPFVNTSHLSIIPQQRALFTPPLTKGHLRRGLPRRVEPRHPRQRHPYIAGEEEKIEWETLKILGGLAEDDGGALRFDMHAKQPLRVSAACNRVPVIDGHTECVSVRFARRPPPSPQQVREALAAFTPDAQALGCPSAPRHTIVVHEAPDRPQPRLDRYYQDGAGSQSAAIINAEVAVLKNVVQY
ncbi:aspartate-semialdehyde dehydrogenase [Pholiota molesta]|nr:aspartate-semialdehyde dehydrogenase [Pholiota molesta]